MIFFEEEISLERCMNQRKVMIHELLLPRLFKLLKNRTQNWEEIDLILKNLEILDYKTSDDEITSNTLNSLYSDTMKYFRMKHRERAIYEKTKKK